MLNSRGDYKFAVLSGLLLLVAFAPRNARATLGETESTVQSDVAELQASIKTSTDRVSYRVHEIQMPSGTVLREFVSLDGHVFAVAWHGPYMLNLRPVLGRYFDSYVAAANQNLIDRHHLQIQQSDLVMQVRGHMRSFTGRAYLPAAVPEGVNPGELQ